MPQTRRPKLRRLEVEKHCGSVHWYRSRLRALSLFEEWVQALLTRQSWRWTRYSGSQVAGIGEWCLVVAWPPFHLLRIYKIIGWTEALNQNCLVSIIVANKLPYLTKPEGRALAVSPNENENKDPRTVERQEAKVLDGSPKPKWPISSSRSRRHKVVEVTRVQRVTTIQWSQSYNWVHCHTVDHEPCVNFAPVNLHWMLWT